MPKSGDKKKGTDKNKPKKSIKEKQEDLSEGIYKKANSVTDDASFSLVIRHTYCRRPPTPAGNPARGRKRP